MFFHQTVYILPLPLLHHYVGFFQGFLIPLQGMCSLPIVFKIGMFLNEPFDFTFSLGVDLTNIISVMCYCFKYYAIKINAYSMKQPDLYYFETIKMTSQA